MDITKIQADLRLLNTRITKMNVKNSLAEFNETTPGKKTIDVSYDIVDQDIVNDNVCRAVLDLSVNLKAKYKQGSFNIHATIRGAFESTPNMDVDTFRNMLQINGCAALYSIIRGTISIVSTQLFSNGNIVLPLVNFVNFKNLKENDTVSSN